MYPSNYSALGKGHTDYSPLCIADYLLLFLLDISAHGLSTMIQLP